MDYERTLKVAFEELRKYWVQELPQISTLTTESSRNELALPPGATTRLSVFIVPATLLSFYKSNVFPLFVEAGFVPVTHTDVIGPGENIAATIEALVERARLVVADLGGEVTLEEVLFARKLGKQLLLIMEEGVVLPRSLHDVDVAFRPAEIDSPEISAFLERLSNYAVTAGKQLEEPLRHEAERLLGVGAYGAAVVSAVSLLEVELRDRLSAISVPQLDKERGRQSRKDLWPPLSLSKLIELGLQYGIIEQDYAPLLKDWISTRNRLLHGRGEVNQERAVEIVQSLLRLVNQMRAGAP